MAYWELKLPITLHRQEESCEKCGSKKFTVEQKEKSICLCNIAKVELGIGEDKEESHGKKDKGNNMSKRKYKKTQSQPGSSTRQLTHPDASNSGNSKTSSSLSGKKATPKQKKTAKKG